MASFIPPQIQDNPNGWGPNDPPEQFKDLPYAPFSKGDRLGKVDLIECRLSRLFLTFLQILPTSLVAQSAVRVCVCVCPNNNLN